MHPRDREALYNSIKRYLGGEEFTHFDLKILVGKLQESEQEFRTQLTELEQEYDELYNRTNAIPWIKYNPENPPTMKSKFLVIDDENQILTAIIIEGHKFGLGWWESNGRGYVGGVTHYAELNLPEREDTET
ncbi:hypothetical protein J2Z69_000758 [Paenibacillus shirakamiensis]|uniref:Uncharacterized protein n=1 Tax=Paenibacillus shirakamiensis TaxID=1265935 RepID=A0ABS4JGP8_9BACL|nr:hypothetical protein [Paenibacillus shirakamiensis]MBP1999739.1 hypothetical protein [Paenibacillus shirakamiensis]